MVRKTGAGGNDAAARMAEYEAMLEEIFGSNPRAGAVTGAAYVDDLLSEALRSRLPSLNKSEDKRAFVGAGAPLGTFSGKIIVGFGLGIFGSAALADLRAIKDVRNAFAHQIAVKSFNHKKVLSLCMGLHYPRERASKEGKPEEADPRFRFHETVGYIMTALQLAAHEDATAREMGVSLLNYPHSRATPEPAPKKVRARPTNWKPG